MAHSPLDTIGLKYETDKSSDVHDYLVFYERFFAPLRNETIKILEIGVFRGASLKTWQEYFPNATVIGADIDNSAEMFRTDRIKIEIMDQSNLQDLVDLGMKHGPFDIILEDGSHIWDHQIITLKTLFPFLKNGGYYVVEDLQTNFGELSDQFRGVSSISCMEYLKKLADYRVGSEEIDVSVEEDAFLRTYGRSIGFMAFHRHACLIEKRHSQFRPRDRGYIDNPLIDISNETETGLMKILAHISDFGDVINNKHAFINVPEYLVSFIQGFKITVNDDLKDEIIYRARLSSGAWTEWVKGNTFVGSRGQRENLTGYSVRISENLEKDYDIMVLGAFSGDAAIVHVKNGEECTSKPGFGPMRGMHVFMKRKRTFDIQD